MPHILEAKIRDADAAFGRGDLDGYLSACTDDFIFNVPGGGAIGGSYRGKEGLYDLARKAPAPGNRKTTGPHTFTGFAAASWLNAGSIHAIRLPSMTLGAYAES
jgi:hypothetical protein